MRDMTLGKPSSLSRVTHLMSYPEIKILNFHSNGARSPSQLPIILHFIQDLQTLSCQAIFLLAASWLVRDGHVLLQK